MSTPSPRPRHRKAGDETTPEGEAALAAAEDLRTTAAAPVGLETRPARRRQVRECGTPGCTPGTPATKPEDAPEQCAAHYDSRRGYVAGRED